MGRTYKSTFGTFGLLLALVALAACDIQITTDNSSSTNSKRSSQPGAGPVGAPPAIGKRTKTTGCVSQNALPDPACTPGAVLDVTTQQICTPGYSTSVRDVPTSEKDQVYAEYGIAHHTTGEYEVDHLVSLELGGANDIANLWPEPAEPRPGFHEKDKVENYLHDQVCSGAMSLRDAQFQISTNWMAVYPKLPNK